MFEYTDDPGTWKFQKLPDIPKEFEDALTAIGGLNRHGKPNFRAVKGNEVLSDRTERKLLKYFCGMSRKDLQGYRYLKDGEWIFTENIDDLDPSILVMPAVEQYPLGLLRYVIERWVSPEDLEYANRFVQRYGNGDIEPTLREFPREGVYDLYQVVERRDGSYRPLDNDILLFIKKRLFIEGSLTLNEAEVHRGEYQNAQEKARQQALNDIWAAAASFDLKIDPEERERREAFWANYTNEMYAQDAARL